MTWTRFELVASLVCAWSVPAIPAFAQADRPGDINRYRGVAECELCHSRGPTPTQVTEGVLNRACLNEVTIWREADRHADAYKGLLGDLGQRIGAALRVDVSDVSAGCIACHATPDPRARLSDKGVSCEACHGASRDWIEPHRQFTNWSKTPIKDKTALGWTDIRSASVRAEVCLSCHVGSAEEGRLITHAMHAAGHPPLAGFEVESFADHMPRHWRYAQEKSGDAKPLFQRTRNLLVAAVVSMRMAVELAAADASAPQSARWPEFARLDCFACHHELESPGWRQLRKQSSSPGRPLLVVGCAPLIRVAAATAAGPQSVETLDAVFKQLQAPLESNPFGDPAQLAALGGSVGPWCRSIEERLASIELTPPQTRAVLSQIAQRSADEYRDYDTARQLLGAWLIVYGELDAAGELQLAEAQRRRVNELLDAFGRDYPQLAQRGPVNIVCGTDPPAKRDYNQSLSQNYQGRIQYDPQHYKALMTELARLSPQ